jgi:hypothetical protein
MRKSLLVTLMLLAPWAMADSARYQIPIQTQGAHTYYVASSLPGVGESLMLVDTGSGYSVINEDTLAVLMANGEAEFLRNLKAVMADGGQRIVPLYRVSQITLGDGCVIRDIEAAVLPSNSRMILGIHTLQKAAPFGLSFDPPTLSLSQCGAAGIKTAKDNSTPVDAGSTAVPPLESLAPAAPVTTTEQPVAPSSESSPPAPVAATS